MVVKVWQFHSVNPSANKSSLPSAVVTWILGFDVHEFNGAVARANKWMRWMAWTRTILPSRSDVLASFLPTKLHPPTWNNPVFCLKFQLIVIVAAR